MCQKSQNTHSKTHTLDNTQHCRGTPLVRSDEEYRKFMADLGGAPPPELMGIDADDGAPRGEHLVFMVFACR